MQIDLIFPQRDLKTYEEELGEVNRHIGEDNLHSFPVRFLADIAYLLCIALTFVMSMTIWRLIIYLVTAQSLTIVLFGIAGCFALPILLLYGVEALVDRILTGILVSSGAKYKESYTTSEYTERKDENKYAYEDAMYYKQCAVLKHSDIYDVNISLLDGGQTDVSIAYQDTEGARHVARVQLPYETRQGAKGATVDLEHSLVVLPETI